MIRWGGDETARVCVMEHGARGIRLGDHLGVVHKRRPHAGGVGCGGFEDLGQGADTGRGAPSGGSAGRGRLS